MRSANIAFYQGLLKTCAAHHTNSNALNIENSIRTRKLLEIVWRIATVTIMPAEIEMPIYAKYRDTSYTNHSADSTRHTPCDKAREAQRATIDGKVKTTVRRSNPPPFLAG